MSASTSFLERGHSHVYILINDLVRTAKKAQHFTITKINFLMLFKEVISVYTENHTKTTTTKYRITDC
jgi:hypothetical protein